jgi:hypothetical protein
MPSASMSSSPFGAGGTAAAGACCWGAAGARQQTTDARQTRHAAEARCRGCQ